MLNIGADHKHSLERDFLNSYSGHSNYFTY